MKSGPILDVCPNCGAPLEADEDGKCRWCRAHVRVELPWSDAGLLKDSFDESLQVYAPEEIWAFDLAFDVIAMLSAIEGLRGGTRASLVDSLRSLDRTAGLHTFKKDLKKAGSGPEALRDLRSRVPHRTT